MAPLLFLDLDDVLVLDARHTRAQVRGVFAVADPGGLDRPELQALWGGLIDAAARANLRQLHEEFRPAYVISSSWSRFLSRDQFCELCRRTALAFVASRLHARWATPQQPGRSRLEDIWLWQQAHLEKATPLLALDDEESGWSLAGSHLDAAGQVVLCEVGVGLTAEKLGQARQLLRAQLAAGAASP